MTRLPQVTDQAHVPFLALAPCSIFSFGGKTGLLSTFPNLLQKGKTFLTGGSVTRNSYVFTKSETSCSYLQLISL